MTQLPTGMVTFLFTDIEGSTRLWDAFPDDTRQALSIHDEVMTSTVLANGGVVVKHTGDGMFVAFASAPEALACAVDAQHQLATADWPSVVGSLGVRMALHTAQAEPTGNDYFSPDVSRTARIEAAGHGGQVLLSQSTAALVVDRLPDGLTITDLGEHLLRGLSRPERIHQVTIAGLPSTFPPLRTASTIPTRLPRFATSFVGRDEEVRELSDLAATDNVRFLTLHGPGGIGKSRLAAEVAARVADTTGAVAHFLPLEPINDVSHIVKALAASIGFTTDLHISAQITEQTQVFDRLRGQPLVLVLDNLEHLPEAGTFIAELIDEVPNVTVIGTSRRKVGITAEQVATVSGLGSHPQEGGVALLVDRAAAAGAALDASDPQATSLVQLLGGMPLAIELAAAWTPILSLAEIIAEIHTDLDFLTTEDTDVADRHRSVRAVFEQTWRRLDPSLRDALASMTVFVAPFTREAATAVTGATLPTLAGLTRASLLQRHVIDDTYSLHPLLREFAAERRTDSSIEERYARFYLQRLNDRAERILGADQLAARDELVEELEHLRAGLAWAMRNLPDEEIADLVMTYGDFIFLHSWTEQASDMARLASIAVEEFGTEGALSRTSYLACLALMAEAQSSFRPPDDVEQMLSPALSHTTDADGLIRALALTVQGIIQCYRSEYVGALEWFDQAEVVTHPYSPTLNAIFGSWKGWAQLQLGDAEAAAATFTAALVRATDDRHSIGRAFLLSKLGVASDEVGDHRLAADYHLEGREIFVKAGDLGGQGYTLSRLSWTHYLMENYDLARRYALEGLDKFEEMSHRWGIAVSQGRAGLAEVQLGRFTDATVRFFETLRVATEASLPDQQHYGVIGIGMALASAGHDAEALRLLAGSAAAERNPYVAFATSTIQEIRNRGSVPDIDEAMISASTLGLAELVDEARRASSRVFGIPLESD